TQRPKLRQVVVIHGGIHVPYDERASAFIARWPPGVIVREIQDDFSHRIEQADLLPITIQVPVELPNDERVKTVAISNLERSNVGHDETTRPGLQGEAGKREGQPVIKTRPGQVQGRAADI